MHTIRCHVSADAAVTCDEDGMLCPLLTTAGAWRSTERDPRLMCSVRVRTLETTYGRVAYDLAFVAAVNGTWVAGARYQQRRDHFMVPLMGVAVTLSAMLCCLIPRRLCLRALAATALATIGTRRSITTPS